MDSRFRGKDAVIYGPDNGNGLIDETGTANAPEVGDAPAGSSIDIPSSTTLCLPADNRFAVSVTFETVQGGGRMGDAQAIPLDSLNLVQGGIFYFLNDENPEFLVKVLDGCGVNDHYWVFFAATTNIGFDLTVTDTATSTTRVYTNPGSQPRERGHRHARFRDLSVRR